MVAKQAERDLTLTVLASALSKCHFIDRLTSFPPSTRMGISHDRYFDFFIVFLHSFDFCTAAVWFHHIPEEGTSTGPRWRHTTRSTDTTAVTCCTMFDRRTAGWHRRLWLKVLNYNDWNMMMGIMYCVISSPTEHALFRDSIMGLSRDLVNHNWSWIRGLIGRQLMSQC